MDEEYRPKILPSSMRDRERYLAFDVISEQNILMQDLINTIWHSILNFLGEAETSRARLKIIKDSYDEKNQMGILRCSHESVENVRASLALIQRIGDIRVVVRILGVSGSIKATKMKFFGDSSLADFTV
jgi:ribonuclease P/MRP protein subunit POP5